MADVPLPGAQLTPIQDAIPGPVNELLEALWAAGQAGYVVGGSLRDLLLDRPPADWDLASDARPERILALFPEAAYENRFGTVAVPRAGELFEITTFRSDHDYADFRRPHRVVFTDTIELDLARRDFTVNAMAWGARPGEAASLVDPFAGRADVAARTLRTVGDPQTRFQEDALRMVRAIRLAATLDFEIEPATMAGLQARAPLAGHLSGERIATELNLLLAAETPSIGLRLMCDSGLLKAISPDLAAQRGIPQNKVAGEDLWDHTLRSVDAASPTRPIVRLAALLHDIGKPATFADGHFLGHEAAGAQLAGAFLDRLHSPRAVRDRVVELVRNHMFSYEPGWSDAAVRRFIAKIGKLGQGALGELLELREADNVGSGLPPGAGRLDELKGRIAAELAAGAVLDRHGLAVDGADLRRELGLPEGPILGRILEALVERVIADPALNEQPTLLLIARSMVPDGS